ncbi:MAG: DUF4388 domain-containing protein [Candidatus Sericytochromatia bacterium]
MNDRPPEYMVFEGESGDNFVIPSIIQFLALLNKSGKLSFSVFEKTSAYMYVYDGNLTHTELNRLGGVDVVSHMFCWNYGNGKFSFRSDYTGDKILYKSLGKLVPQQILMRVMQRNDECAFKKDIHSKFSSVNCPVALNESKINQKDRQDPIKGRMIERLERNQKVTLSDLITDVHEGEVESCRAFHELLRAGIVVNSEGWDKPLPSKYLLDVLNIISKFTDQNIALKFLADKKHLLELESDDEVTIRKLKKLAVEAKEDFTKLLPQAAQRWVEMRDAITEYINGI